MMLVRVLILVLLGVVLLVSPVLASSHQIWYGFIEVNYIEGRHLELVSHCSYHPYSYALIPKTDLVAQRLEGAIGKRVAVCGNLVEVSIYGKPTILVRRVRVY